MPDKYYVDVVTTEVVRSLETFEVTASSRDEAVTVYQEGDRLAKHVLGSRTATPALLYSVSRMRPNV